MKTVDIPLVNNFDKNLDITWFGVSELSISILTLLVALEKVKPDGADKLLSIENHAAQVEPVVFSNVM